MNKQKGMPGGLKDGVKMPQQTTETQIPVEENKMSILKKWWFWAIVGAVILIGVLFFFVF